MKTKQWQISKAGSIDQLKLVTIEIQTPDCNEVLVEVKAIGLNFADVFACQGLYSATPKGAFTPGLEFSGIIMEVGYQVKGFKVGDKVMGVTRFGAYTTHIAVSKHYIKPLPTDWSFEAGAALMVQGLTAWYGLKTLGGLTEQQWVLVQSAAGGVGLQALNIIKNSGAHPIAVVGSQDKSEYLQKHYKLEPDQIIVRNEHRFENQLSDLLHINHIQGYHLVLDAVFGPYFKPSYQNLLPMGRYILFGAATMMNKSARPNWLKLAWQYINRSKLDPLNMISENKSMMAFNLIWLFSETTTMSQILSDFLISSPNPPVIDKVFSFEECHKALTYFQKGQSIGKLIMQINS